MNNALFGGSVGAILGLLVGGIFENSGGYLVVGILGGVVGGSVGSSGGGVLGGAIFGSIFGAILGGIVGAIISLFGAGLIFGFIGVGLM